jgi:hypothetical protein
MFGEDTDPAAELKRTTTMSTRNIAVIATLATLIAAPAFALDQDTAAVTVNSGRTIGQQVNVPSGAYASARRGVGHVAQPAVHQNNDFQLEGRGL